MVIGKLLDSFAGRLGNKKIRANLPNINSLVLRIHHNEDFQ